MRIRGKELWSAGRGCGSGIRERGADVEHRIGGVELGETGVLQIDVERNNGEGGTCDLQRLCMPCGVFQEFLRAWRPVPSECASEDFAVFLRTSCLWWTLQRQVRNQPTK